MCDTNLYVTMMSTEKKYMYNDKNANNLLFIEVFIECKLVLLNALP